MLGLTGILAFLTGYIVPFVLVLSLLVFVHEMGHYLVGRWSGIRILAFSIGFGPELVGFTGQARNPLEALTRYRLAATSGFSATRMHRASPMSDKLSGDVGRGSCAFVCRREALEACRHGCGRPDCQFRPGDRDFCRSFLDLWPIGRGSRCRGGQAGQCCCRRRVSCRVTLLIAIDGAKVETFDPTSGATSAFGPSKESS